MAEAGCFDVWIVRGRNEHGTPVVIGVHVLPAGSPGPGDAALEAFAITAEDALAEVDRLTGAPPPKFVRLVGDELRDLARVRWLADAIETAGKRAQRRERRAFPMPAA